MIHFAKGYSPDLYLAWLLLRYFSNCDYQGVNTLVTLNAVYTGVAWRGAQNGCSGFSDCRLWPPIGVAPVRSAPC